MSIALAIASGLLGTVATAMVARRERRAALRRRRAIFDRCLAAFDDCRTTVGRDGFPRIVGHIAGRSVMLEAVPDSLTTKRLPQLWLCVTLKAALPIEDDLAVLVRPTGAEFFALTHRLRARLHLPVGWPGEALLRGSRPAAQAFADQIGAPVAALLADPRVKEVAVTRRGLRVVYQADEGRRGEYLLLRQCAFADCDLAPATVLALLDHLMAIERAAVPVPSLGSLRPMAAALA